MRRPIGEFHLKSLDEKQELFANLAAAACNRVAIAERCNFDQ